jgi:hypothetical protein
VAGKIKEMATSVLVFMMISCGKIEPQKERLGLTILAS